MLLAPRHDLQQDGLQGLPFFGQMIGVSSRPLLVDVAPQQTPFCESLKTFGQDVGRNAFGAVLKCLKGLLPVPHGNRFDGNLRWQRCLRDLEEG